MKFILLLLTGALAADQFSKYFEGDPEYLQFRDDMAVDLPSVSYVQEQYGDITVTIEKNGKPEPEPIPDRYSQASDDHLMNTLISKGFAFAKNPEEDEMRITVDCGCNFNCCFGQKKNDLVELSMDCGCDCGCCNIN
mmetsp:Transcript_31747/g.48678  ORF Transcript_31747/g.48678 Transcript_31747/m.48678 type:complete len:137 (+) Transcript_31747:1-411(+)